LFAELFVLAQRSCLALLTFCLLLEDDAMQLILRSALTLVFLGTITLGFVHIDPKLAKMAANDFWDLPGALLTAKQARDRGDELSSAQQMVHERLERKAQIASKVAEGALSLREAADQFLEAAATANFDWDTYRNAHPEWPLAKRCAHLVIDDIALAVRDRNEDPTAIEAALRAQVAMWDDR
jgi:hypothetical protein